ncbi:hypothetical protein ACFOHS_15415 [Jhaorihella thermophila]
MQTKTGQVSRAVAALAAILAGPPALAFAPAISLGAFWIGGEGALMLAALGLPALLIVVQAVGNAGNPDRAPVDAVTGLLRADGFRAAVSDVHANSPNGGAAFLHLSAGTRRSGRPETHPRSGGGGQGGADLRRTATVGAAR